MRIMSALLKLDDGEPLSDAFGILRITQALSKMLISRKMLMELAGALYTDYFVMEFTESSMKVEADIGEKCQIFADVILQGTKKWEEISDLPYLVGAKPVKVGWNIVRLTKNGFWWVLDLANDGEYRQDNDPLWLKVRSAELPWDLVLRVAGEFDPKAAVSDGSFLIHWDDKKE